MCVCSLALSFSVCLSVKLKFGVCVSACLFWWIWAARRVSSMDSLSLGVSFFFFVFFHSISHVYLHLQIERKKTPFRIFSLSVRSSFLFQLIVQYNQSVFADKAAKTVTFRIEFVFFFFFVCSFVRLLTRPSQARWISVQQILKFFGESSNWSRERVRGREEEEKMK